VLALLSGSAVAQVPGPVARPSVLPPAPALAVNTAPAKQLFGAARLPSDQTPRAIGFYAKGCLAGGRPLATDGPAWQVMRLSRNRNWGHPNLVATMEKLAGKVRQETSWPGLLFGDMSQPRGGPMLTGHASHQIGLDADIWLNPMPRRTLTAREREDISAISMANANFSDVDPKIWTPDHVKVIRLAATMPGVERVLVNPVIKKALCREAKGNRSWLSKVRPYWGHHYHMHVRMSCQPGSDTCKPQAPVGGGEECGKQLDDWLALVRKPDVPPPPPKVPPVKKPPPPPMKLADLPPECRAVLAAPDSAKIARSRSAPALVPPPVPAPGAIPGSWAAPPPADAEEGAVAQ